MKTLVCAAFALLLAAPASAQQPADDWLEDLEWASKPSGNDMAKYYPDRAARKGRGGWAILSCRVAHDRRLTKCKVAAEGAAGDEFGHASLALTPMFRVKRSKDGRPVEGGRVRIPMKWSIEGDEGPPITYPAGDPSMLVQVAETQASKGAFPCPSKAAPDRMCLSLPVTWAARPKIEDLAGLIGKAGDGTSVLECSVDASGALEKCRAANTAAGLTDNEVLSLAKLFKAEIPPSGETVSQRVMLTFDWKVLRTALDVFAAT